MSKHQANKDEEIVQRPARLPQKLWLALDDEAKRCRRSSIKQLEAILLQYYGFEDVELHFPSQMSSKKEVVTLLSTESAPSDKKRQHSNAKRRGVKSGSRIEQE